VVSGTLVAGIDVAAFAATHARLTAAYLTAQERLGCIRPSWRFAWVAGGAITARVVYWGLRGASAPCLVDVVLGDDDPATTQLLAASLDRLGIGAIDYQPTRTPGAGRSPSVEPAALEACGFALVATQRRLRHAGPAPAVVPVPEITLATADDVGDDALAALIAEVRAATADRATAGGADAAEVVASLRACDHEPAWWTIAIDRRAARPVGFVLPIRTDGDPAIADIGVVPGARGRGLGRLLLAHATAAVLPGAGGVVADVDDDNAAMLAAAARVGYQPFSARAHYVRAR
jgi:GNAT superfamily N-acetyltransferase